jgi:methylmalonyl-CoA mutase
MSDLKLASEFPAAKREDWFALVNKALKGASPDTLVSKTYDGLRIEPLYERAKQAQPVAARAPGAPWQVVQRVDHPDAATANKEALHDLENGATGLSLLFAGAPSANEFGLADVDAKTLARVLENVWLDAIPIRLDARPRVFKAAESFLKAAEERGIELSKLDVALGIDPLGALAALGGIPEPANEGIAKRAEFAALLVKRGFRGQVFIADGRPVHDAGGSEVQELSWMLASAVTYLRAMEKAGLSLDQASAQIAFLLSADADQFLTMAKFRAARKLWARVEEASGLPPKPIRLHAETAWRMMTRKDSQVNWLRATLAAFSAGVGGADSISVLPHTAALGFPDRFARRVVRNLQLLLTEESNVHRVYDPAAGSGAIEDLTEKLCAAAWKQFQAIEAAGGAFHALDTGTFQKAVATVRTERIAAMKDGRDPLVGTSVFPNPKELPAEVLDVKPPAQPSFTPALRVEPLPRIRLGEPFE